MKFDPTKPVQAHNGSPARIIATNVKGAYPIVAIVADKWGGEYAASFTSEGRLLAGCGPGANDLVNIPVKVVKTFWLNIYPGARRSVAHSSEDSAILNRTSKCVATVPIQVLYEEGEGL